jgi:hypothetical protein
VEHRLDRNEPIRSALRFRRDESIREALNLFTQCRF